MIRVSRQRPSLCSGVAGRLILSAVSAILLLALFTPHPSVLAAGETGTGAGEGGRAMRGDPVAGKAIYNRYCHFCHGRRGTETDPWAQPLPPTRLILSMMPSA